MRYEIEIRRQDEKDAAIDKRDLLALRKAKEDPRNRQGRPFSEAVQALGLKKKLSA